MNKAIEILTREYQSLYRQADENDWLDDNKRLLEYEEALTELKEARDEIEAKNKLIASYQEVTPKMAMAMEAKDQEIERLKAQIEDMRPKTEMIHIPEWQLNAGLEKCVPTYMFTKTKE